MLEIGILIFSLMMIYQLCKLIFYSNFHPIEIHRYILLKNMPSLGEGLSFEVSSKACPPRARSLGVLKYTPSDKGTLCSGVEGGLQNKIDNSRQKSTESRKVPLPAHRSLGQHREGIKYLVRFYWFSTRN